MPESEREVEDGSLLCLTVSPLWIFAQTAPSSRIPENCIYSSFKSQLKGYPFYEIFPDKLFTLHFLFLSVCLLSLSPNLGSGWEADKLRFFQHLIRVLWWCENSYCNILVLKEVIYSGYSEGVWRLRGAPRLLHIDILIIAPSWTPRLRHVEYGVQVHPVG